MDKKLDALLSVIAEMSMEIATEKIKNAELQQQIDALQAELKDAIELCDGLAKEANAFENRADAYEEALEDTLHRLEHCFRVYPEKIKITLDLWKNK